MSNSRSQLSRVAVAVDVRQVRVTLREDFGVKSLRGSSRVWRRLTDDQLEHKMLSTIDNRRQTRIETRGSRYDVYRLIQETHHA